MKLNPDPDIHDRGAQVSDNDVDLDEREVDSDTCEVNGDADMTTADAADERPGQRGLGGFSARLCLVTAWVVVKRTLRQIKAFGLSGIRALVIRWRLISLVVALVAAVGLAGSLFFLQYRPNQQTDDVAAHAVIKSASDGTVALLSYSPETLDNDVAAGKSHLTGELLRYFTGFSQYFVTPAVRSKQVKASASVLRAALIGMHPNSAVALLFVHQTTSSKDKPDPVLSTNNVRVTLTKVDGSWLIAKFEPE